MRHLDGKLLWIQNRKDFKMVQPTDSNMADTNTKPQGQRMRYLMNLIGYWHNADQTRVGERERKVYEEEKNFVGKVSKIAKMLVRMVALEGLLPMVKEAFIKEKANTQCGLDAGKNCVPTLLVCSSDRCLFLIYKHFEISYSSVIDSSRFRFEYLESLIRRVEKEIERLESKTGECEKDEREERATLLHNYAKRIHCGLILYGGFVENEVPDLQSIISCDALGALNAGNFLARRSLEDMQATEGQYWGHRMMLQAATDGATPSEGPLSRVFKIGNKEASIREQYVTEQPSQMCGRFEAKLEQLNERRE